MSASPKPRKRAVRLTPAALDAMCKALAARWQEGAQGGRLTHETRAELMGVSVATAKKILANGGVDRATLAHAFQRLGLSWDDAFCEPLLDEPEPQAATVEEPPIESAPEPVPARRPPRRRLVLMAALLAVAAVGWTAFRYPAPKEDWTFAYGRILDESTARFHRADYAGARIWLQKAVDLAWRHDSASSIAFAWRVAGDLEEEQGRLVEARDHYRMALKAREHLAESECRPPLYEALGVVETRLKEYESAKRNLTLCLEGYRSVTDPVGVALASRDLGTLALAKGELDAAERWFVKSLDALRGLSKPDIVADVQGQQAMVLLERGRMPEAHAGLERSLAYWTAKGHPRWIARCGMRLGLAEARLGKRASARRRMTRSKVLYERVGDAAGVAEAATHLRHLLARRS